jgi:predicted O-methyltransferase YrrM
MIPCLEGKEFTQWWHCNYLDMWQRWIPKDIKRALEIGSFEGMSAIWLLDYCPDAKITCIDVFGPAFDDITGEYEQRFDRNVAEYGKRVTKLKGKSHDCLATFSKRSKFDFIYIDGHHTYEAVKQDIALAWPLLKAGGLMIFDDYDNAAFGVRQAVDEFLVGLNIEVLRKDGDYQMAIKKTAI